MSKFIELKKREYWGWGDEYILNNICVSLNDIARIVQCLDDYSCAIIVTKDGKTHPIDEKYSDIVMRIRQAEGCEQDG